MIESGADWSLIPPHMHEAVRRYVERHEPVGDFLTAVLSNDLRGAYSRADSDNIVHLPDYVTFLYNYVPAPCWGSPEAVKAWLAERKEVPGGTE